MTRNQEIIIAAAHIKDLQKKLEGARNSWKQAKAAKDETAMKLFERTGNYIKDCITKSTDYARTI